MKMRQDRLEETRDVKTRKQLWKRKERKKREKRNKMRWNKQ